MTAAAAVAGRVIKASIQTNRNESAPGYLLETAASQRPVEMPPNSSFLFPRREPKAHTGRSSGQSSSDTQLTAASSPEGGGGGGASIGGGGGCCIGGGGCCIGGGGGCIGGGGVGGGDIGGGLDGGDGAAYSAGYGPERLRNRPF